MSQGILEPSAEQHRSLAAQFFNHAWELIEKADRTPEHDEEMLRSAYASLHHWHFVGSEANFSIGEWQIAFIHCLLARPEGALHHAKRAAMFAEPIGPDHFTYPFGFEIQARALACAGRHEEARPLYAKARELGQKIADDEDRQAFQDSLEREPWFGLDRP